MWNGRDDRIWERLFGLTNAEGNHAGDAKEHDASQRPAARLRVGVRRVNPPVHAWAAWQVYRIDGYRDQQFLIRVFTKLLLNFSASRC